MNGPDRRYDLHNMILKYDELLKEVSESHPSNFKKYKEDQELIAGLKNQCDKLAEALKDCEEIMSVQRPDDYESLRLQDFKKFSVHELDTGCVIVGEALEEYEKYKEKK